MWIGQGDSQGRFTIPACLPGTTPSPTGTRRRTTSSTSRTSPSADGETVDLGVTPVDRLVDRVRGLRVQRHEPQRRAGSRRGRRAQLRPDLASSRQLPHGPRDDRRRPRTSPATTGSSRAYPLTQWIVLEAYNDIWYTTGVTFQADNQHQPTTVQGAGVDVSVLPIIGLGGRIDWGVHAYDANGTTNGARPPERRDRGHGQLRHDPQRTRPCIRGRRGLAARRARPDGEPLPAGGLRHQRRTLRATPTATTRSTTDGSFKHGHAAEHLHHRDLGAPDGLRRAGRERRPAQVPGQPAGPALRPGSPATGFQNQDARCHRGPARCGVQFQPASACGRRQLRLRRRLLRRRPWADDRGATVCDGGEFDAAPGGRLPRPRRAADNDDEAGDPMYKFTREEDINIGNGDAVVPQAPPPACVGALHTVDDADFGDRTAIPAVDLPDPSGTAATRTSRARLDADGEPDVRDDIGGSPVRGPAEAALRHEARDAQQRPFDRAHVQRVHGRAAARPRSSAT